MRVLLSILLILISLNIFSQELNLGGSLGTELLLTNPMLVTLGGALEYRPAKCLLSFNFDPALAFQSKDLLLTLPLYLKIIIGNKFRFCPFLGGFIRTNANYGWNAGFTIEFKIKKQLFLFAKADYDKDYWISKAHSHFGSSYEDSYSGSTIWISLGIKKNILK